MMDITSPKPISREEAVYSIAVCIILAIITCGIYGWVWQYRQFRIINAWLGREEHDFWKYFFLTLITCGIYGIYYEYKFATTINEVQQKYDLPFSKDLPVIAIILGIMGLGIVTWAIEQNEINKWYGASAD